MLLLEYHNPYWKANSQNFLELLQLIQKYPNNGSYVHRLNTNGKKRLPNIIPPYKHLRLWIEEVTHEHNIDIKDLTTRVYWVVNGLVEAPRCKHCNKPLVNKTFDVTRSKQPIYCSILCSNKCSKHTSHSNATKKRKFHDDPFYWKDIEHKRKLSKVEAGYDQNWVNSEKCLTTKHLRASDDAGYYTKIEKKRKATKLKNGHDPNWHNEKQMVVTRYAKNNGVWESQQTIQRKESASLLKYGCKSPNSSDIVKKHKKEGCLKKFGVDSYSKTQMYHDQMVAANEQRDDYAQLKTEHLLVSSSKACALDVCLRPSIEASNSSSVNSAASLPTKFS